jgi:hypothetical protein
VGNRIVDLSSPRGNSACPDPAKMPHGEALHHEADSVKNQNGPTVFKPHDDTENKGRHIFHEKKLMHGQGKPSSPSRSTDTKDLVCCTLSEENSRKYNQYLRYPCIVYHPPQSESGQHHGKNTKRYRKEKEEGCVKVLSVASDFKQ